MGGSVKLGGGNDDGMISDINITPLVDVVLVLLIIFMVTASLILAPVIKVELPTAASGETSEPYEIGVIVMRDGTLRAGGLERTPDGLRVYLRQKIAEHGKENIAAWIQADRNVTHGRVITVIDILKTEGINKFAFNIELTGG